MHGAMAHFQVPRSSFEAAGASTPPAPASASALAQRPVVTKYVASANRSVFIIWMSRLAYLFADCSPLFSMVLDLPSGTDE